MAGRIAGITIKIGANTSELQKSLKGLDSTLKKTQSNLKDVNRLLKFDPGNTQLLAQKQKNLETAIKGTRLRVNELKTALEGVAEGSEEWDALQREIVDTEQQLKRLETEYRNFGSVGAQQVAAVGAKMQEAGEKISGVGQKLMPVSAAAGALLAAMGKLGLSAVQSADELNTLAKQTGISTEELQKMQYASDLVDVSLESITGAVRKMKAKMDPANETFQQLGVSVTDADGQLRDATSVFYDTIAALSQVSNETERDQLAMELFGKSADELAGIIDDGGAALREYGKEAEDLGLILSQDTLDALNETNDTVDRMKATFRGAFGKLGATIATTFAPAVEKAAELAKKLADRIANLSPEQVQLISKIAGVAAALAPVLVIGGKLVSGVGKVLTLAPKIATAVKLVTAVVNPIPLLIAAAVAAAVAAGIWLYNHWEEVKAWAQGVAAAVSEKWNALKDAVVNAVQALRDKAAAAWDAVKQTVTKAVANIYSAVVAKFNAIKATASNVWNGIKTSVTSAFDSAKAAISTTASTIYSSVISKFNAIRSVAGGIWTGIKNSVSSAINGARDAVSSAIDKIKGFFNFEISWPHIPLPHFKISPDGWKIGDLLKGTIPSLNIDWYRRAYDNPIMFTNPTVMATPGGYKGFGDGNGAEIVMGLNKLRELVGSSGGSTVINIYPPQGANVEQIAAAVEQKLVAAQQRRLRVYA